MTTNIKDQMKQVVGELETVLGELSSVVGDLRGLMSDIDVVTYHIDENCHAVGNRRRRAEHRRRHSEALPETGGNSSAGRDQLAMRHSASYLDGLRQDSERNRLNDRKEREEIRSFVKNYIEFMETFFGNEVSQASQSCGTPVTEQKVEMVWKNNHELERKIDQVKKQSKHLKQFDTRVNKLFNASQQKAESGKKVKEDQDESEKSAMKEICSSKENSEFDLQNEFYLNRQLSQEDRYKTLKRRPKSFTKRSATSPTEVRSCIDIKQEPDVEALEKQSNLLQEQRRSQVSESHHYSEPIGHYSKPTGHYSDPTGHYSEPIGHYSKPTGHYSEQIGHYLEPIGHYSAPTGHCSAPQIIESWPQLASCLPGQETWRMETWRQETWRRNPRIKKPLRQSDRSNVIKRGQDSEVQSYCGVYEKDLDQKLEFGDDLAEMESNFTVDDRRSVSGCEDRNRNKRNRRRRYRDKGRRQQDLSGSSDSMSEVDSLSEEGDNGENESDDGFADWDSCSRDMSRELQTKLAHYGFVTEDSIGIAT